MATDQFSMAQDSEEHGCETRAKPAIAYAMLPDMHPAASRMHGGNANSSTILHTFDITMILHAFTDRRLLISSAQPPCQGRETSLHAQ